MRSEIASHKYKTLFNPQSVAIVGATDKSGKVGTAVIKNLLNSGYAGRVYFVNPSREQLFGQPCWKSLEEIEEAVDLAVIIIPATLVNEVILKSAHRVKNFLVISAGFGESGAEGKQREKEMAELAKSYKLNILGPNCLGFINPYQRINLTFAGSLPPRGKIALISQSGALSVALIDFLKEENLGFSGIYSIGNRAVLDETALLSYLESDDYTKVISLYLEGIKEGSAFLEAAGRVAKKKPVIILKAGRTEKAREAAMSHTGALAGSEEVAQAAFRKANLIQAANFQEFVDLLKISALASPPENNEVIIITNAGGLGVLAVDAFGGKGLKVFTLSETAKNILRQELPPAAVCDNPIDLLGDAGGQRYQSALDVAANEKASSVICLLTAQEQTPMEEIAERITAFAGLRKKTIIACFAGGEKMKKAGNLLTDGSVPNFSFPEQAVTALDKYFTWNRQREKVRVFWNEKVCESRKTIFSLLNQALEQKKKTLSFQEASQLVSAYGIPVIKTWRAGELAGLSFPVAAKVDSQAVVHKTEKKAVILNIKDEVEMKRAVSWLETCFPGENIIFQPMRQEKLEVIAGFSRDPVFGPVVVYGLGGIYTEFFQKTGFLILPLSQDEIEESIKKSQLNFLFEGARGVKPYPLHQLAQVLQNLGRLAWENPEIKELDINPLFLYNDGRKVEAVDIRVVIGFEKNKNNVK